MAIERAPEIEQFIKDGSEAFRRGDDAVIEAGWSRDPSVALYGSAPVERWEGHETIVAGLREIMTTRTADELPPSLVRDVTAYHEGDVGWAVADSSLTVGDDEIPARATAVLHREDGDWKIVVWTFSVLVPDEALESGSPLAKTLAGSRKS